MLKKNPEIDIINDILKLTMEAYPSSTFVKSLFFQYHERGGLSKSQLEGLQSKASKLNTIPPAKMATLQAIILKKPVKDRTVVTKKPDEIVKDEKVGEMINAVLSKNPTHKMVVIFKIKYDRNEVLTPTERSDLEKFYQRLV